MYRSVITSLAQSSLVQVLFCTGLSSPVWHSLVLYRSVITSVAQSCFGGYRSVICSHANKQPTQPTDILLLFCFCCFFPSNSQSTLQQLQWKPARMHACLNACACQLSETDVNCWRAPTEIPGEFLQSSKDLLESSAPQQIAHPKARTACNRFDERER